MGCAVGCLACALLVVNNLRDIPTDAVAGKRTLAVRLGDAATRWLYVALARRRVRARRGRGDRVAAGGAARPRRAAVRRAAGRAPCAAAPPGATSSRCSAAPAGCSWPSASWPPSASPSAPDPAGSDFHKHSGRAARFRDPESSHRVVEEAAQDRRHLVGLFEVHGVAGAGDDVESTTRRSPRASDSAMATNLASSAPATISTGIVELAEAVPQRPLGAGAGEAQARGQSVDGVGLAVGDRGRVVGQPGEHRLRQPAVDERRRRRSPRAVRPAARRRPARRARSAGSTMPGVALTSTSRLDHVGVVEGDVQGEASAHRVADVRRPAGGLGEGGGTDRRGRGAGPPTTRGRARRRASTSQSARERRCDRLPRAGGLGEAVDETTTAPLSSAGGVGAGQPRRRRAAARRRTCRGPAPRGSTTSTPNTYVGTAVMPSSAARCRPTASDLDARRRQSRKAARHVARRDRRRRRTRRAPRGRRCRAPSVK